MSEQSTVRRMYWFDRFHVHEAVVTWTGTCWHQRTVSSWLTEDRWWSIAEMYESITDARAGLRRRLHQQITDAHRQLATYHECLEELGEESDGE